MTHKNPANPADPAPPCHERLSRLLDGLPPSTASAVVALFAECEARHADEQRRLAARLAFVGGKRDSLEATVRDLHERYGDLQDYASWLEGACATWRKATEEWQGLHAAVSARTAWWQALATRRLPVLEAFRFREALGPPPVRTRSALPPEGLAGLVRSQRKGGRAVKEADCAKMPCFSAVYENLRRTSCV